MEPVPGSVCSVRPERTRSSGVPRLGKRHRLRKKETLWFLQSLAGDVQAPGAAGGPDGMFSQDHPEGGTRDQPSRPKREQPGGPGYPTLATRSRSNRGRPSGAVAGTGTPHPGQPAAPAVPADAPVAAPPPHSPYLVLEVVREARAREGE